MLTSLATSILNLIFADAKIKFNINLINLLGSRSKHAKLFVKPTLLKFNFYSDQMFKIMSKAKETI